MSPSLSRAALLVGGALLVACGSPQSSDGSNSAEGVTLQSEASTEEAAVEAGAGVDEALAAAAESGKGEAALDYEGGREQLAELIPNGILIDSVLLGGQPSEEALGELARAGYKAVVNLRGEGEFTGYDEAAVVSALKMNYIHIPVSGGPDLTRENLARFDAVFTPDNLPALIHCASGNRVGAFFALSAAEGGMDPVDALAIGQENGLTSLTPVVEQLLQSW